MRFRFRLHLIALFLFLIPTLFAQSRKSGQYVVMLSMDAFRYDYPEIYKTKELLKIAKTGVRAKSIISSFPTVTFPNHYAMATGLYPDHHGIVLNNFFAPDLGLGYKVGDRKSVENGLFYDGEPIWTTAQKQGLITASYFWVGSETKIKGYQPNYWKLYDHKFPFSQRIDTVLYWLSLPEEKRPRLITFYMAEPDEISHHYGPISKETGNMVRVLDSLAGVLINKIKQLPIADSINIIFTSDHGMEDVSADRSVRVDNFIPKDWITSVNGSSPVITLNIKKGYVDSALLKLSAVPHIQAWKRLDVPARLHFGTNPRIGDIVVLADSAWNVGTKDDQFKYKGAHGFDNANMNMHGIFIATGPAFKDGYLGKSIQNVSLYPLIAKILRLTPMPVDGTLKEVEEYLKP